jgi:hypothetical protein
MPWGNSSFAGNPPFYNAGTPNFLSNLPEITIIPAVGSELVPGSGIGSNSVPLTQVCRGLICSGAGNVSVAFIDGTSDSVSLNSNTIYGMLITQVFATGTTATGIHGLH